MTEPEIFPPPVIPKGRPAFTEEIFQQILDRMTEGEGLSEICRDPELPSKTTFLRWVEKDTGRQRAYQGAREALMDHYAEEIRHIAWNDSEDTIKREGKPDLCNHEWINRSRLKVDTLKFLMAKLHPKRYGDKTELLVANDVDAPRSYDVKAICWVHVYPMLRADGSMIKPDTPEYHEEIQRAAREAHAQGLRETTVGIRLDTDRPPPPAQVTFQPDPIPDLTAEAWSLLSQVLRLVKQTIPSDDASPPEAIFRVIREALLLHFREVGIEPEKADAA
ncbi:hypothetical protein [Bradyrhizobium sp. B120]|uniref:terminase small subunit-like protein n=1 Tax=Bradyrhizobium sp. B120 TaxID=3410088 RepID=UPI003B980FE7